MKPNSRRRTRPPALVATAVLCTWLALAAPAGARTDPPSTLPAAIGRTNDAPPTIIHETIAAPDTGDATLPIALAAGALLVAIAGTGYSVTLATRTSRQLTRRTE